MQTEQFSPVGAIFCGSLLDNVTLAVYRVGSVSMTRSDTRDSLLRCASEVAQYFYKS
jgi:hypothetical protein